MRIIYFSRDYTPHDHRFLSYLAGTDHVVYFLQLEKKTPVLEKRPVPDQVQQLEWAGGKEKQSLPDYYKLVTDLRRVIKEIRPDLIHAGPVPKTAFLTALTGYKPLVSMSWGSDLLLESRRSRISEWKSRFTLYRTAVFLGDCYAVQDRAVELGFPVERTILFPWGVDIHHFLPGKNSQFRQEMGWQDCFVLLSLRSWEPVYGVDLIVRSFSRAVSEVPQLRLILIGQGTQSEVIKSIIKSNGLDDKVFLVSNVLNEDLPDWYQSADLYLSASYSDGSSVSLLESLACGLPVLVSDIPGNREWITPGEHGWLFKSGDENDLAEGILNSFTMRNSLQVMGMSCRSLAIDRADESKNFQKLLDAYELALSLSKTGIGRVKLN